MRAKTSYGMNFPLPLFQQTCQIRNQLSEPSLRIPKMPSPRKIPKTSDTETPKVTENSQNFPKIPNLSSNGFGNCHQNSNNSYHLHHLYSNMLSTFWEFPYIQQSIHIFQLRGSAENSQYFTAARADREFPTFSRCAG